MKKPLLILSFLLLFFIVPNSVLAAETIKPALSWQRSTEAADKVVTENALGSKLNEALALPLDPNQPVFDNGVSTAPVNKNAVPPGINWSSWRQFSAPDPFGGTACGPLLELRHFQATFNLGSTASIQKIILQSPYYPPGTFPINDNAYIYLNNTFITRFGTSYSARNVGMNGRAPYANETDGWVASGLLPQSAIQSLRSGPNTLDIVTGETCRWGGMGKLELVLEITTPTPFLDLPWDYAGKGLSFNEAANRINSFFDHEYPLLSSGLIEPNSVSSNILIYRGPPNTNDDYSSHDGYDYGRLARVNIGDLVLAAAAGCASYQYSGAGGNMIFIDHGNGYQTRYLHLHDDGLLTKSASCITVSTGQPIGLVGYTGNVHPPGEEGAHIHFMVIQDKNGDGNFDDNIPDGVTDPFGWQSTEADPWASYPFNYGGQNRTGNASYYLWTKAIANLSQGLTANGGFFELERYKLNFPQGATNQTLNLEIKSSPMARASNILHSIGSTVTVTAKNIFGQLVTSFQNFFTITVSFDDFDLTRYDTNTLTIYSSQDGINWTPEATTVDYIEKTASAKINHLSHFALMAERIDTTPPTTTAVLSGQEGEAGWFRSDVTLTLDAQDNPGGLGVDYTLYKIGDGDWKQYGQPLLFTDEGNYSVEFYSADNDENIESIKTVTFNIDKTAPEAKIYVDPNQPDLVIEGIDANQITATRADNPATKKKNDAIYTIRDLAGNTVTLDVRDRDQDKKDVFSIFSLQYNQDPLQDQPKNIYRVSYSPLRHSDPALHERRGEESKTVKEQTFEIKGEVKIRIKYDAKKDQSAIITRENGQEKVKEIRPGLTLLQITTSLGKLGYSY